MNDIGQFLNAPKPAFDNKFYRIEAENGVNVYDELHHGKDAVWEDAHRLIRKGYTITLIQED